MALQLLRLKNKSCKWLFPGTLAFMLLFASCSYPKNFTRQFYFSNQEKLISTQQEYKTLHARRPFAVSFTDKNFQHVSFEIITDTVKYIYHFALDNSNLTDTLKAYHYNATKIHGLLKNLQALHCTWISQLEYYEDYVRKNLVLMSMRNKDLNSPWKGESYCTLAFFDTPQPYDEKGRFLDRADKKRKRYINGSILYRLTDKIGYTISKQYR